MSENERPQGNPDFNRRDFVKATSLSGLMLMMGGVPILADTKTNAPDVDTGFSTVGAPVSCALIGCGLWGREILQTLALLPNAPVVAICETYPPFLRRAQEYAPKAVAVAEYQKVLEMKEVQAVIVATPTHQHREIVEAALKAGKHVYCEAPTANTIEDAKAIALAAKAADKLNFQTGLQMRSDPGKYFVRDFVRNGAIGDSVMARSQFHHKETWRHASPNPEREKAGNWRLDKALSTGLAGEVGVHQIDLISWYLNQLPVAVTGWGAILNPDCKDGREVSDTIQSVLQYPGKVNFSYDATLASSFDGEYNMLYGNFATIMMRENKAWLFKEDDSPLLGWEIYATKMQFYKETGITLAAGASHSVQKAHVEESPFQESILHYSLKAFIQNCTVTATGVKDFFATYGADADGLGEYLASLSKSRLPAATYQDGFEATVSAIKTNEAIVGGEKIALTKEMFAL
jgi:predicted dehydrogenase